jgi:heat shock protein HslJ
MGTSVEGLGGYGGCNWFGITRENGRTLVTGTARGCGMEINEQERAFTLHLGRARFAVRSGDTLRLLDSTRTETLVLTRRLPTGANGAQLVGTSWKLLSSTNPNVPKDSVTITFTRDSVSGFGGCRRFGGTWVARGERLSFTSLGMFTTDCIRPYADVAESYLTGALSETEHFAFQGDTLVLTTFDGDTLRWLR